MVCMERVGEGKGRWEMRGCETLRQELEHTWPKAWEGPAAHPLLPTALCPSHLQRMDPRKARITIVWSL